MWTSHSTLHTPCGAANQNGENMRRTCPYNMLAAIRLFGIHVIKEVGRDGLIDKDVSQICTPNKKIYIKKRGRANIELSIC